MLVNRPHIPIAVAVVTLFCATLGVSPALAYDEIVGGSGRGCNDCHGLEAGETSPTVVPTRKGPHGGYSVATNKCQTCHSVHGAAGALYLLPASTIRATCETCHDGTGGQGVYGTIKARTGQDPVSAHNIETPRIDEASGDVLPGVVIPGGNPDGTERVATFSGSGGTLTCSDCHSPHDAITVEPFLGDRHRSGDMSPTVYALETNRLLRQMPTSAEGTVAVYGAGWCISCHQGGAVVSDHPVHTDDGQYYYNNVERLTSVESTETEPGSLGQSNLGYLMPDDPNRTEARPGPICQQCHEDARDAYQEFSIMQPDGLPDDGGGGSLDNPRFQTFPHESNLGGLLISPSQNDALCKNCHSSKF